MKKLTEYSTYKEVTREFRWGMLWDLFDGNKKNLNIAHECLDRHVDKGTAIRLKFADRRTEKYTFKELSEWTSSFANFLESYGVQVGDRVCVMLEPSLEFYVCMFGPIKRGIENLVDRLFYKDRYDYRQLHTSSPKRKWAGSSTLTNFWYSLNAESHQPMLLRLRWSLSLPGGPK